MRHAEQPARLEHADAARHLDEAAIGIGHARDAVALKPLPADDARGQDPDDREDDEEAERQDELVERASRLRRRAMQLLHRLLEPGRVPGQRRDVHAGLDIAEQRQHR